MSQDKGQDAGVGLSKADCRLTDQQHGLMETFWQTHDEGLKSAPYFEPFGVSRLPLGGAGQALVGLLRRGLVEERRNLFYVTPRGLALRAFTEPKASSHVE